MKTDEEVWLDAALRYADAEHIDPASAADVILEAYRKRFPEQPKERGRWMPPGKVPSGMRWLRKKPANGLPIKCVMSFADGDVTALEWWSIPIEEPQEGDGE